MSKSQEISIRNTCHPAGTQYICVHCGELRIAGPGKHCRRCTNQQSKTPKKRAWQSHYRRTKKQAEYRKKYKQSEKYLKWQAEYRQRDKYREWMKKYLKEYYKKRNKKLKHLVKHYRQTECSKCETLRYVGSNCKKCERVYDNEYNRNQYHTNIQYRLSSNLRSRLRMALKGKSRKGSAVRYLGCSLLEFKRYLEQQFQQGMSWKNYGLNGWTLDHIISLGAVDLTDKQQFLKVCHFTNLRPLWFRENASRGCCNAEGRRVVPRNKSLIRRLDDL